MSNLNLAANLQYPGQRWYDAGLALHLQPSPFGGALAGSGSMGMAGVPGGNAYASRVSSGSGGGLDLLGNPLVTFALNKALISTGLDEPWPKGLIEYRLTKGLASTLTRIPNDLTLNIGHQFVADFRTAGTVVGVSLESAEEAGRSVFQLSRGPICYRPN